MSDSESEEVVEYRLKVVVVGDGASGKTSIITRFAQVHFDREYDQTVGVDFYSRRIALPGSNSEHKTVLLEIWDIGGQTLGGQMLDKYIYGAEIVFFVYDVTNNKSFDDIHDWINTVQSIVKGINCDFILVGNKADLEHLRVITKKQHEELAREYKMSSCIVSAKTGEAIDILFQKSVGHKMKGFEPSAFKEQKPKSSTNVPGSDSKVSPIKESDSKKFGTGSRSSADGSKACLLPETESSQPNQTRPSIFSIKDRIFKRPRKSSTPKSVTCIVA